VTVFNTWEGLLLHIANGRALYYQAPLDHYPVRVRVVWSRAGQVRCEPMFHREADPFTADCSHLSRFRRAT
jgi:hypothetical protein